MPSLAKKLGIQPRTDEPAAQSAVANPTLPAPLPQPALASPAPETAAPYLTVTPALPTRLPAPEPEVLAPVLPPPPAAPTPEVATFDAKAMVAAQRTRVENPVYGDLPSVHNEASKAAIEEARERMRRQRRKNDAFARGVLLVLVAILIGCLIGLYFLFQADQKDGEPEITTPPAVTTEAGAEPGAATPLGQQEQVIEVMDDLNSGASPGAGGLVDAINDAKEVVGAQNDAATSATVAP